MDKNTDQNSEAAISQNESISALMDGEAQPLELKRLLNNMADNSQLRDRWLRMQLVSSLLRKQTQEINQDINLDKVLADRVFTALEKDNTFTEHQAPEKTKLSASWWPAFGGFAMAASVTLVVVMGVQNIFAPEPSNMSIMDLDINQGITLIEPQQVDNRFQAISISPSEVEVPAVQGEVIRISGTGQSSLNLRQWSITGVPDDFHLIQYGQREVSEVKQDVLVYGNGLEEFTLYIEPLQDREIASGSAFSGNNLILGRQLQIGGEDHIVTLVGNISVNLANQVVDSISINR